MISSAAKISLCAYFEEADWPLNKALPRGAEFSCGLLGDIVRQYCLEKSQVARQLLNYKKGRYLNTQVSILLNQSNLEERIREGMAMSTPRFVSTTLLRICDPEPSSYGLDFSNLCVVMNSLPSTARTYVRLLASSPDDACFWKHHNLGNLVVGSCRGASKECYRPINEHGMVCLATSTLSTIIADLFDVHGVNPL